MLCLATAHPHLIIDLLWLRSAMMVGCYAATPNRIIIIADVLVLLVGSGSACGWRRTMMRLGVDAAVGIRMLVLGIG